MTKVVYFIFFIPNFVLFFLFSNFHKKREGLANEYAFAIFLCITIILGLMFAIIEFCISIEVS